MSKDVDYEKLKKVHEIMLQLKYYYLEHVCSKNKGHEFYICAYASAKKKIKCTHINEVLRFVTQQLDWQTPLPEEK